MEESKMRSAAYVLIKPDLYNDDPAQYLHKNIKELLDYEYIRKVNNLKFEKDPLVEITKLVKVMKARNSK